MIALLCFVLIVLLSPFKSKSQLDAENVALRHQVMVLRRQVEGRVHLTNLDRLFLVRLYHWFPFVVWGETHLRRILRTYARYYNDIRTHSSLDKDAPAFRPIQRTGIINSHAILGGLHHHYVRI